MACNTDAASAVQGPWQVGQIQSWGRQEYHPLEILWSWISMQIRPSQDVSWPENVHRMGVQNEHEFHFTGAEGRYGMARRESCDAEYKCGDTAVRRKGKKKLQRFMLSVDVAASVVGNLLLLLQPSVACKRGDSQLMVSREAVRTISPVPSSLELSTYSCAFCSSWEGKNKWPAPCLQRAPLGVVLACSYVLQTAALTTWVSMFSMLQWLFPGTHIYPTSSVICVGRSDLMFITLLCWGLSVHCWVRSVPLSSRWCVCAPCYPGWEGKGMC